MIKNYMKIYLRQLKKNKLTNFITIGGFSLSLAITLLFTSFILEELSVDKHLGNLEKIYQVIDDDNTASIEIVEKETIQNIPGVKKVSYYSNWGCDVTYNRKSLSANVVLCEEDFFDIFSIEFFKGNSANIFNTKEAIVISKSFAEKIFGNEEPIDQIITLEHNKDFVVKGIINNLPKRASIHADLFVHTDTKVKHESLRLGDVNISYSRLFIQFNGNVNVPNLQTAISDELVNIRKAPRKTGGYHLKSYKNSYFGDPVHKDHLSHANINLILLIGGVTLLIVLLSSLNYVNLSIVLQSMRRKEFGIKKASGANKKEIFYQILFESFVNIVIAISLGFILFEFLNPVFLPLLGREVTYFILLSKPEYVAAFILFAVLLAAIVGFYPGYKASKTKPVTLIKQNANSKEGTKLRNIITSFQFVISTVLIISLIVVYQQSEHLKTKDLGFNKEELLKIDVHYKVGERANLVKQKILQHPNIISVSNTAGVPGATTSWFGREGFASVYMNVDEDFIKTFDLKLLKGRFFNDDEKSVCVVNETALSENEITDWENNNAPGESIVGVVKDFNHQNLYKKSGSITLAPLNKYVTTINVKIRPKDVKETIDFIKDVWQEVVPEFQFEYSFYDEWIDNLYKSEERNAEIVKIFSVIAIFLALLGLYGMTEISVAKKMKEFSIRKVFGANGFDIFILQNKGMLKWNLISIIIAVPIAYYVLSRWLENYIYRVELNWSVFAYCGLVILLLSFFTTSYKIFMASLANPVDSLRDE